MNHIFVAVYALIQNKTGQYLFIKRADHDSMPRLWEVPGGKMEYGEEPKDSLKREVMEEAGLEVEVLNPFCVVTHKAKDKQMIRIVFKTKLIGDNNVKLSSEHSQFKWSDFSDVEIPKSYFLKEVYKNL
jgi:mutator protein MutT